MVWFGRYNITPYNVIAYTDGKGKKPQSERLIFLSSGITFFNNILFAVKSDEDVGGGGGTSVITSKSDEYYVCVYPYRLYTL